MAAVGKILWHFAKIQFINLLMNSALDPQNTQEGLDPAIYSFMHFSTT